MTIFIITLAGCVLSFINFHMTDGYYSPRMKAMALVSFLVLFVYTVVNTIRLIGSL